MPVMTMGSTQLGFDALNMALKAAGEDTRLRASWAYGRLGSSNGIGLLLRIRNDWDAMEPWCQRAPGSGCSHS